jgi:hypothetical protein
MSAPRSVTAEYGIQFQLRLATVPVAVGTTHVHGASDNDWFDAGTEVDLTADLNVDKDPGERYHFTSWSGDTSNGSVKLDAPKSVTANYGIQYQLSLATVPAAVGTDHIHGATDHDWFDAGTKVDVTADENVAKAAGERYHFTGWSGDSSDGSVTMSAPKSVIADYGIQYQLRLATDPAAVGTSHIHGAADNDWFDAGTDVHLTADENVFKAAGERYHFTGWSGNSTDGSVTMSAPKSVTADYGVQYQLSLATDPAAVGTDHIHGAADGSWHNSGSTVTLSADANVFKAAGERYHFTSWAGDTSDGSVAMSAPKSVTAEYGIQYQLTLATDPAAVGTSHIAGSVSGQWFDAGATAGVVADVTVAKAAGERYHFTRWAGDSADTTLATSVTMDAPRTLTAKYGVQYQLTLATNPAAVGNGHIAGASSGDWFDDGRNVDLTADLNVAKAAGERYHFTGWSDASTASTTATSVTMSGPKSVTATYGVQYQLSLATSPAAVGTSHISGASDGDWFNSGATAGVTADEYAPIDAGSRYRFNAWSGASTATSMSTSVTMTSPKSLTAGYVKQWKVTFGATGLDGDATGTVVTVGSTTISAPQLGTGAADRWVDDGGSIGYSYTALVTSSVAGKQYSKTSGPTPASPIASVTAARTVTAGYGDEYPTTVENLGIAAKAPNTDAQYSDTITLSATVKAVNTSSGPLNGTVKFTLNGKPVTPVAATVSGNAPQTVTADLRLTAAGVMPAGSGT